MRNTIKPFLHTVGLLAPTRRLYANIRTANASLLRREIRYRMRDELPDGHPIPPGSFIFDVIGVRWGDVYFNSGRIVVDDMEHILAKNDLALNQYTNILDFGCGSGRLTRHVAPRTEAAIYGTDYNAALIEWSRNHLPFGSFNTNNLRPPLRYPRDSFDFIYARSVFNHFPEELQIAWVKEIQRVLKPEGVLYLTTHGPALSSNLSEDQQKKVDEGRVVTVYEDEAGGNLCASFQGPSHVRKLISDFDLLDYEAGKEHAHLRQDVYLCRWEA